SALLGSTTTRTLLDSTRMSRLAGPSTRSILYCNPEQPPPMTATRSAPCGRPCRCNNCESFAAALPVTFTRRSFPILYFISLTGVTREYGICVAQKQTRGGLVGRASPSHQRGSAPYQLPSSVGTTRPNLFPTRVSHQSLIVNVIAAKKSP